MAVKYFSKPVFLATLICVIFFYSQKSFVLKDKTVNSLVVANDISLIKGNILSSPVKISNGKYYSCKFLTKYTGATIECQNKKNEQIISSAKGEIEVFIPTELVEAYFPGKLFSITKKNKKNDNVYNGHLFEKGGTYTLTGRTYNNSFYTENCKSSYWDKSFFGKLNYFRALCRLHFKRLMYKWGNGGGLLLALLSGAKEYTNENTAIAFKNAGLSHILALSGMHLSMFSAIALFIGKKIGRKKLSYIIRICALIIFVWFAGFSPSLLRAFICAMMMILGSIAGVEQPDMLMILCFSFLFQSMISPADIYNIGFILSYGALAGILITSKLFQTFFIKIFPTPLASSLSASTGAQIFTAPISLKMFGTFCPIGIVATAIVSPLITLFIYTGLFLILISLIIPILEGPSGIFINLQYNVINNLVIFFSHAPIWRLN